MKSESLAPNLESIVEHLSRNAVHVSIDKKLVQSGLLLVTVHTGEVTDLDKATTQLSTVRFNEAEYEVDVILTSDGPGSLGAITAYSEGVSGHIETKSVAEGMAALRDHTEAV